MPRRRTLAVWSVALLLSGAIHADNYADWRTSQQQAVSTARQAFQSWKDEQDLQFEADLKAQWHEFQVFQGRVRDDTPKPKRPPVAPNSPPTKPPALVKPGEPAKPQPVPVPIASKPEPVVSPAPAQPAVPMRPIAPAQPIIPAQPITPTQPITPAQPIIPARPDIRIDPRPAAADSLNIDFHGNRLSVSQDPAWRSMNVPTLSPDGFGDFWNRMARSQYDATLKAVNAASQAMQLDDWGRVKLWHAVAQQIRPDAPREQILLQWFFLLKSGFDARVGYNNAQLYLLLPVKQPVYGVAYIEVSQRTYYILFNSEPGSRPGRFSSYASDYPAPLRVLDIGSASTRFAQPQPEQRVLSFPYQGRTVTVAVSYDRNLIRYLDSFPQLGFDLYFATPASALARQSLLDGLKNQIRGMKEEDALNFLLAFVQRAFPYKTDDEQFGYEKYFFVEDILHYPYSDCEDRSALFAWLVRELLGLPTVGLHYPGHMTTGVALRQMRDEWNVVLWSGDRYVIADPTYINAKLGMAMPQYAGAKPLQVFAPSK